MTAEPRPIRAIIADDELAARSKLRRLLSAHRDIVVVDEASTGLEAIDSVRRHRPDLLFLDIRMPEVDGLTALGTFDGNVRPLVVFVTAYDAYAVRAFAEEALDYLLKPFDADRLAASLERVRERRELSRRPTADALRKMIEQAQEESSPTLGEDGVPREYLRRVTVRSTGKIEIVLVSDIEWIEAAGNYVRLHTPTARPLLRETMRNIAQRLDPKHFVRIHRGALVNLDTIVKMEPLVSGDCIVRLRSGIRLRMSRSFRPDVELRLRR
ncbi:MAG TPA: response regulator [Gemmatimonadaceae bacterium]|jgi:two-component system LytT family response regulator